jgi:hypothetical protein
VHHSIQEDEDEGQELHTAAAAAGQSASSSSSSSSSSSGIAKNLQAAAAAAKDPQRHERRVSHHLKLLMRCYLRCIELLESPCEVQDQASHELHSEEELHYGDLDREVQQQQQQQQQQLSQVSNAALVAAARLAARLVGKDCLQHTWWARSRGHMVLAEAAIRFKVRL